MRILFYFAFLHENYFWGPDYILRRYEQWTTVPSSDGIMFSYSELRLNWKYCGKKNSHSNDKRNISCPTASPVISVYSCQKWLTVSDKLLAMQWWIYRDASNAAIIDDTELCGIKKCSVSNRTLVAFKLRWTFKSLNSEVQEEVAISETDWLFKSVLQSVVLRLREMRMAIWVLHPWFHHDIHLLIILTNHWLYKLMEQQFTYLFAIQSFCWSDG